MGKRQDLSQLPGDVRNRGNKNPTCGGRFTTLDLFLILSPCLVDEMFVSLRVTVTR